MDAVDNEAVEKVKGGKEGGVVGMARHSGQWRIVHKHFFMQQGKLTCADYHKGTGMLVAGFSTGIFTLYKMPGFEMVHTLSVSRERLSSVKFSENGDWCVAVTTPLLCSHGFQLSVRTATRMAQAGAGVRHARAAAGVGVALRDIYS
jgi:hypothetical protein